MRVYWSILSKYWIAWAVGSPFVGCHFGVFGLWSVKERARSSKEQGAARCQGAARKEGAAREQGSKNLEATKGI